MNFASMEPKSKREIMIIAALVPLLGILLWVNFVQPAIRRKQAAAKTAAVSQGAAAVPKPILAAAPPPDSKEALARIRAYEEAPWKANPFQGPLQEAARAESGPRESPTPTFRLQGIVWDPPSSSAVIDGEVRGVGDTIGEFLIVDITKDTVSLRKKGGQVLDLQLFPDMR